MMDGFWFSPFEFAFVGAWLVLAVLFFAFWVWMIVDCVKRTYRNDVEKIVWILVIVFGSWIGAVVYFFVIKMYNQKGLAKK